MLETEWVSSGITNREGVVTLATFAANTLLRVVVRLLAAD